MRSKALLILALLAAGALAVGGCTTATTTSKSTTTANTSGGEGPASTSTTAPTAPVAASEIKIVGTSAPYFDPNSAKAKAGSEVKWTNAAPGTHTVTADDGSFDLGEINAGSSKSQKFDKAGTFGYHCSIHPFMKGSITIE